MSPERFRLGELTGPASSGSSWRSTSSSSTRAARDRRKTAAATLIHECCFSSSGYFGNDDYDAYLNSFAALEVWPKGRAIEQSEV